MESSQRFYQSTFNISHDLELINLCLGNFLQHGTICSLRWTDEEENLRRHLSCSPPPPPTHTPHTKIQLTHRPPETSGWTPRLRSRRSCPLRPQWRRSSSAWLWRCPPWPALGTCPAAPPGRKSRSECCHSVPEPWRRSSPAGSGPKSNTDVVIFIFFGKCFELPKASGSSLIFTKMSRRC